METVVQTATNNQLRRSKRLPTKRTRHSRRFLSTVIAIIFCATSLQSSLACQTCLWPKFPIVTTGGASRHLHHLHHQHGFSSSAFAGSSHVRATTVAVAVARQQPFTATHLRFLLLHYLASLKDHLLRPNAAHQARILRVSIAVAVAVGGTAAVRHGVSKESPFRRLGILLISADDNQQEKDGQESTSSDDDTSELSAAMIGAIGFYKNFISPLLPPACRFVPTCSQYGVQAIKEFGPTKGAILTSWRLLRCSPLGGKGYDPPKWPPVPYTYSSY
jgi:uncharacterized protein